jgi:hypothetical protein
MEDCINIQNKNGYIDRKVRREELKFRCLEEKKLWILHKFLNVKNLPWIMCYMHIMISGNPHKLFTDPQFWDQYAVSPRAS